MLPALVPRLGRLLRWPRRVAALLCLLLAAATAGHRDQPAAAGRPAGAPAASLAPGEVAVPVPVRPDVATYLRAGQRVSLFPGGDGGAADSAAGGAAGGGPAAGSVADGVRVLAPPSAGPARDGPAVVVVAATRAVAARIAARADSPYLAVLDNYP